MAYGIKWMALRYFNAAGAWPDGSIGEDHADEIHLIPLAIRAATGGPPLKVFGEDYPTPDGTCLRDYIHVCDLASAHICALEALERGARRRALSTSARARRSRSRRSSTRSGASSAVRSPGNLRRAGREILRVLYAASDRAQRELGWRPQYADLEVIVRHAWQWHSTHPRGYAG